MKVFVPAMILIFLIIWFLNYPILSRQFDLQSCGEQYDFWMLRSKVYEFMFLTLASVCFISCSGVSKAFACFAVIMIAGSLVDKIVFGVTGYVWADIVLIFVGLIVSVLVWKNKAFGTHSKT